MQPDTSIPKNLLIGAIMDRFSDHYISQIGRGYVYDGGTPFPEVSQRGCGIGSYLGGLFRKALPHLKKGGQAVRKEVIRAGTRVAKDHLMDKVPLPDAISDSVKESRDRLKRKAVKKVTEMLGGGYKTTRKRKTLQSRGQSRTLKTKAPVKRKSIAGARSRVTKKRKIEDIFT